MKKLAFVLSVLLLCYSCSKESGSSGNMSFKANGVLINSAVWNVSYGKLVPTDAFKVTNVTSNMHKDKRAINININAAKSGTYELKSGGGVTATANKAYGSYYKDYFKFLEAYTFQDGEITIDIDTIAKTISGTFFGTAEYDGETVEITEGQFSSSNLKKF